MIFQINQITKKQTTTHGTNYQTNTDAQEQSKNKKSTIVHFSFCLLVTTQGSSLFNQAFFFALLGYCINNCSFADNF